MKHLLLFVFFAAVVPLSGQLTTAPKPLEGRIAQADIICICVLADRDATRALHTSPDISLGKFYTSSFDVIQAYKGISGVKRLVANLRVGQFSLVAGVSYLLMMQNDGARNPLVSDVLTLPKSLVNLVSAKHLESIPNEHFDLESDIDLALASQHPADIEDAVEILSQYGKLSVATKNLLATLTMSDNDRISLISLSILLRTGFDVQRFFPIFTARLQKVAPTESFDIGDIDFLFSSFATARDIPDLETLTASQQAQIRYAAMRALRKIADPRTTTFLVQQLDSSDSDMQYLALITLAEIYHKSGDYAPGLGLI